MTLVAGADAGGSKTTAAVARDGVELTRVIGPGAAVRPGRAMSAGATIARLVRSALNQTGHLRAEVLVVGAAGVGRDTERAALRDAIRLEDLADRLVVTTDLEIALAAAFPGEEPGIVLLAGTGSVAVARLPGGHLERRGGHGWQLGDEGGGYALGRAALAAVSRAQDGRGPDTALTNAVFQATRSAGFDDLIRWTADAEAAEVAALAAIATAAVDRDAVASKIVAAAAEALASHADPLAALFGEKNPVPVALGGGLLAAPGYRAMVEAALARRERLRPRSQSLDPVAGALALARTKP